MQLSTDILILLAPAALAFLLLLLAGTSRRVISRPPEREVPPPPTPELPENPIVVDGSNVMHWGGEASAVVLARVLRSLERAGYAPIVFFDASAGYRLGDRYFGEEHFSQLLEIPATHICVVDKGVVADQAILCFAADHDLRVVTNDRYRDWRVSYPHAARKGVLLGGSLREGTVVWRGKLLS